MLRKTPAAKIVRAKTPLPAGSFYLGCSTKAEKRLNFAAACLGELPVVAWPAALMMDLPSGAWRRKALRDSESVARTWILSAHGIRGALKALFDARTRACPKRPPA